MSKYTIEATTLNGDSVEFGLSELMPAKYGDDDVFYVNDVAYVFSSIKCVERDEAREQLAAAQARIAELEVFRDAAGAYAERINAGVDRTTANVAAMQTRIAELEALHTALHDALRTMAQSWLTMSTLYDSKPRFQGEAEMLRNCARDLSHALDTALAGAEPAT